MGKIYYLTRRKVHRSGRLQINILVRGVNRLGDIMVTFPAIKSLKINFPEVRLKVLTKPLPVYLYKHNPFIDNIIIFGDKERHHCLVRDKELLPWDHDVDLSISVQDAYLTDKFGDWKTPVKDCNCGKDEKT